MRSIDPSSWSPREAYRWMIASVIPRPIAWVSSTDRQGNANLAPFSFFGGVTSDPPTVMLSVGPRKGRAKDTARNLREVGEAVVHIPDRRLAVAMLRTSEDVAPQVDEFDLAGLRKARSTRVRPPRIAEARLALEARVQRHMTIGAGPVDVFFLEVVWLHVDPAILGENGLPDAARLEALGRLGGLSYCDTSRPFVIEEEGGPPAG